MTDHAPDPLAELVRDPASRDPMAAHIVQALRFYSPEERWHRLTQWLTHRSPTQPTDPQYRERLCTSAGHAVVLLAELDATTARR